MRVRPGAVAFVLALSALSLCAPLVVQSSTATPTREVSSSTPVGPAGSTSEPQPDSEAAVLRAQLEVMRQYDERLLQTVYWALGAALALVVFVAGAGWYVNFRLYERDKEALRSELRSEVETRIASIKVSLSEDLEETRTSLNDTVKQLDEDLHEQAHRRSKEIEEKALQAVEVAVHGLKADIERVRHDMIITQYDMTTTEAQTWKDKGVHVNALRAYMHALSLAMELADEWIVQRALEGIQEALRAGARPGVQEASELTEMLGILPDKYSITVEKLRALISAATD